MHLVKDIASSLFADFNKRKKCSPWKYYYRVTEAPFSLGKRCLLHLLLLCHIKQKKSHISMSQTLFF